MHKDALSQKCALYLANTLKHEVGAYFCKIVGSILLNSFVMSKTPSQTLGSDSCRLSNAPSSKVGLYKYWPCQYNRNAIFEFPTVFAPKDGVVGKLDQGCYVVGRGQTDKDVDEDIDDGR
jgi:hypothetical protein